MHRPDSNANPELTECKEDSLTLTNFYGDVFSISATDKGFEVSAHDSSGYTTSWLTIPHGSPDLEKLIEFLIINSNFNPSLEK